MFIIYSYIYDLRCGGGGGRGGGDDDVHTHLFPVSTLLFSLPNLLLLLLLSIYTMIILNSPAPYVFSTLFFPPLSACSYLYWLSVLLNCTIILPSLNIFFPPCLLLLVPLPSTPVCSFRSVLLHSCVCSYLYLYHIFF